MGVPSSTRGKQRICAAATAGIRTAISRKWQTNPGKNPSDHELSRSSVEFRTR